MFSTEQLQYLGTGLVVAAITVFFFALGGAFDCYPYTQLYPNSQGTVAITEIPCGTDMDQLEHLVHELAYKELIRPDQAISYLQLQKLNRDYWTNVRGF